jgi:hypothetical protein
MARKKHSARRGGRVKGDVASPNAQRRNEIVEEVVDNLRPWTNHRSRDAITDQVNKSLDMPPNLIPSLMKLSDERAYREHAKKLDKALSNVETLLLSSPGAFSWFLFDQRPQSMPLNDNGYPSGPPTAHKSIEEIEREHEARVSTFVMELRRLRKVCARDYGLHPNFDHVKHASAQLAYGLMQEFSDAKISGTQDQAFRIITSLLYEAFSGQRGADLKRACDAVLASTNLQLGTDPPP